MATSKDAIRSCSSRTSVTWGKWGIIQLGAGIIWRYLWSQHHDKVSKVPIGDAGWKNCFKVEWSDHSKLQAANTWTQPWEHRSPHPLWRGRAGSWSWVITLSILWFSFQSNPPQNIIQNKSHQSTFYQEQHCRAWREEQNRFWRDSTTELGFVLHGPKRVRRTRVWSS